MTKYLILFFFILSVISCSSDKKLSQDINCPESFVSKDHKNYFSIIDKNAGDNIDYIAAINNIKMKCKVNEMNRILSIFDILFVITPVDPLSKGYEYSYFVLIFDENDKILDRQLFKVSGKFDRDENNLAKETIMIETLDQYFPSNDNLYSVGVGFVLTEDQYNFINN
tara:strand:- start:22 stop:525 length:504 start_codon:yes stop_codon:yes gene_type:complete